MIEKIQPFNGLLFFLIALMMFILTRRMLSNDILLLIQKMTQNATLSHKIHFILVFPGVFLHEFSHYLALRLMGVAASLHLGVEMGENTVVYGHVDFFERDVNPVQHFITGIAPLITGLLCATLLAVGFMGAPSISELANSSGQIDLKPILNQTDTILFWIAFYLVFAITSEMLPSNSDRTYWLPLTGIIVVLVLLSIFTNTLPWLITHVYPYFNTMLKFLSIVFAICLVPQLCLLIPLRLLRWLTASKQAR